MESFLSYRHHKFLGNHWDSQSYLNKTSEQTWASKGLSTISDRIYNILCKIEKVQ